MAQAVQQKVGFKQSFIRFNVPDGSADEADVYYSLYLDLFTWD